MEFLEPLELSGFSEFSLVLFAVKCFFFAFSGAYLGFISEEVKRRKCFFLSFRHYLMYLESVLRKRIREILGISFIVSFISISILFVVAGLTAGFRGMAEHIELRFSIWDVLFLGLFSLLTYLFYVMRKPGLAFLIEKDGKERIFFGYFALWEHPVVRRKRFFLKYELGRVLGREGERECEKEEDEKDEGERNLQGRAVDGYFVLVFSPGVGVVVERGTKKILQLQDEVRSRKRRSGCFLDEAKGVLDKEWAALQEIVNGLPVKIEAFPFKLVEVELENGEKKVLGKVFDSESGEALFMIER